LAGTAANDTLQYIAQEQGRVRPKSVGRTDTLYYDYFVIDHLGNIRTVLTAPSVSTCANSINSRGHKVYIDPSQNDYADTLAAPYAIGPFHIPTASTPLEWKEINAKLDPSAFTIETMLARVKKKGDLFKGVLDIKIAAANSKILGRLFV